MKTYYTQYRVGASKYIVNYHDGIQTHLDGSPFYDIAIFTNKHKLLEFIATLKATGYKEE